MRSLGRLVRGLSALFWGLPSALVICFYTAKVDGFKWFGVAPPVAVTGLLAFGLWQMGDFQKQERIWIAALDRARLLSLVNLGLSPFLYWYYRVPENQFFYGAVLLMVAVAFLFVAALNLALQRLGAILPDEALRVEIKQFTALNLNLLVITLLLGAGYVILSRVPSPPLWVAYLLAALERGSLWPVFLLLISLLPLAMTMALLWKTKEVILDSVFGGKT